MFISNPLSKSAFIEKHKLELQAVTYKGAYLKCKIKYQTFVQSRYLVKNGACVIICKGSDWKYGEVAKRNYNALRYVERSNSRNLYGSS